MNDDAKKKLLWKIPYGLYVIGLKGKKEINAFAGSWLSQASMEPPMISLGVRKDSNSYKLLKEGMAFSVNFIHQNNMETLKHFFKTCEVDGHVIAGQQFHPGEITGAPILEESIGFLECTVHKLVEDYGDHNLVLAKIVAAQIKKDAPALTMADTPWHYGG